MNTIEKIGMLLIIMGFHIPVEDYRVRMPIQMIGTFMFIVIPIMKTQVDKDLKEMNSKTD